MLGIGNIVFYAGIIYLSKLLFNLLWDFKNAFSAYIFPRICSVDYKEKYGEWAVVTGCTQGIGKCYAEELAQKGLNIVLISRNRSKLETVANQLQQNYGMYVYILH